MRILLYMVLLLTVILSPVKGTDVGKLIPIEVVAVSESDGLITVRTDTGDQGSGESLETAIEDMKDTAPGIIYLDTAAYLVLEEGTEQELDTVGRHLKGGVRICYGREGIPLDGIADFLSVHRPEVELRRVSDYGRIQKITEENGKYQLEEK